MANQYRLRRFLRDDPGEIERLNLMYYHPVVAKAKGYWSRRFARFADVTLSRDDVLEGYETTALKADSREVSYAVADKYNRLVGWVWFYQDSRHPLPRRIASQFGVNRRSRVFAISYEKMLTEGWPPEILAKIKHVKPRELSLPRKGVIVAGLEMAIRRLKAGYRRLYRHLPQVVLYAFVLPNNYASQGVLAHNGFAKEEKLYRCNGVLHQVWVREI